VSAEGACLYRDVGFSEVVGATVNKRCGGLGQSGIYEGGPASFASVGIESELGYQENGPVYVSECKVEFSIGVGEDAHPGYFSGDVTGVVFGVGFANAKQHQETCSDLAYDLAFDYYLGVPDALNYCFHGVEVIIRGVRRVV
jgi:hypothetical protein